MRLAKNSLTYGLLAVIAILTQQVHAQEVAPAPPAIEGSVEAQSISAPVDAPLPLPAVETTPHLESTAACDAVTSSCCDYQPGATCCGVEPYRCCCCGHVDCYMPGIHKRKHNGKLKWCRVWTTGDMYQHYAYYPAHHGYYYFRPYNYTNVLEHKAQIVALGGQRNSPYTHEILDATYERYYESNPVIEPPVLDKSEIPGASNLPNVEELLLDE